MLKQTVFKAMADPTRRRVLALLRQHDSLCAGEIVARFELSPAAVSEHLRVLHEAGLVGRERQGRHIRYHLNTSIFEEIVSYFLGLTHDDKEATPCESDHSG